MHWNLTTKITDYQKYVTKKKLNIIINNGGTNQTKWDMVRNIKSNNADHMYTIKKEEIKKM